MTGATTELLALLVRATRARRVLEVGSGALATRALAAVVPAGGLLITLQPDPAAAAEARAALDGSGASATTAVMVGAASRYLHKIAGPFDVIVHAAADAQHAALHEAIVARLAPGGLLVIPGVHRTPDYNGRLVADARLATTVLALEDGLALAVRIE